MKLSIIVPVYNMASDDKLQFCIESLVNQTLDDLEIILSDDASTDDSLRIMKDYQTKYPSKVKVIESKENTKQGGAKNRALDIAVGEYVGFVDADDWITPDMYETLIEACDKENADAAACDLYVTSKHSTECDKVLPGISENATGVIDHATFGELINNSGYMVVKVYKRSIFENPKLRFPEKMFYEDNAIGLEVCHRMKKMAYVKKPMYFYYQHEGSTVHVVSEERCRMRMEAMRIMLRYAKENGYLEEYKTQIEYKYINLFYQNTLFSYMFGTQRKKLKFIKLLGKEMRNTFPEFMNNPIYLEKVNKEERKLMAMQQKSTLFFVLYFKALWTYRRIRYKKTN